MRKGLIIVLVLLSLLCAATANQLAAPTIPVKSEVETDLKVKAPLIDYQDIDLHLIRRIVCEYEDGTGMVGTAWFFRENTLVTAAHVVGEAPTCRDYDSGKEATIIHIDWDNDFALIEMEVGPLARYISFSCDHFEAGSLYWGTGWAGGDQLKQTQLRADRKKTSADSFSKSGLRMEGLQFLSGNLYSGMSGGPVFNDHGFAVGINSASDDEGTGFSRSLSDTILCGIPRKNKPLVKRRHRPQNQPA
jgi:hypothetical protein